MAQLDDVIVEQYARFDTPADQLVSDLPFFERFRETRNSQLPSDSHFTLSGLNRRIVNLRKRGDDDGDLARLRRSDHGRDT